MSLHILIVDDDPHMRRTLSTILGKAPDLRVVGEASDGDELPALLPVYRPDVVLMDVQMRRVGGFAATRALHAPAHPNPPKVLLASLHTEAEFIAEGLRAGAAGYVFKTRLHQDLVTAVREVGRGGVFVSQVIAQGGTPPAPKPQPSLGAASKTCTLTPVETEAVRLIVGGCTDDVAATRLGLRADEFSHLRARVTRLMSLTTRSELETAIAPRRASDAPV